MTNSNPLIDSIKEKKRVPLMDGFCQHGTTTTLDHVTAVTECAVSMNRRFKCGIDEDDLIWACMLHDYYLYDWHDAAAVRRAGGNHALRHPLYAAANARQDFPDLDQDIYSAIETHMWPLPPNRIPKTKMAWLLCVSDKCVAARETINGIKNRFLS